MPERTQSLQADFHFKFWLLGFGHTIVFAAGLATWMEEHLIRKETKPAPSVPQ